MTNFYTKGQLLKVFKGWGVTEPPPKKGWQVVVPFPCTMTHARVTVDGVVRGKNRYKVEYPA